MLLHIEDDNIKYFKKWLKSINLNVERYGNELLLNDGTTFICHTDSYNFLINIVMPNRQHYFYKTSYNRDVSDICRFDLYLFTYIDDILNGKKYLTN
jgi:hypothetical protein